jgi:hypothetical protein
MARAETAETTGQRRMRTSARVGTKWAISPCPNHVALNPGHHPNRASIRHRRVGERAGRVRPGRLRAGLRQGQRRDPAADLDQLFSERYPVNR